MDTLLFNAALKYSQFPLPEVRITLVPRSDLKDDCWANSLLNYAAKGGVYLTRQGSIPSLASLPIVTPPTGNDVLPPRAWIAQRSISTQGDLYSFSREGKSSWHKLTPTEGSLINTTIMAGDPPDVSVTLRPLQQWLPSSDSVFPANTVVELLGFDIAQPDKIRVRTYISNNRDPVRSTSTMHNSSDPMLGGSSPILLFPTQALGSYPRRVYMNNPKCSRKGCAINFIAEPTLYDVDKGTSKHTWLSEDMEGKLRRLGPFVIYSDGSWSPKGDPWQHVMGNLPEFSGAIGLTFLSTREDWRDLPIYTLQIFNGEGLEAISAFTMELFRILVSLSILSHFETPFTVYSDCEAAIKSVNNNRNATKKIRSE